MSLLGKRFQAGKGPFDEIGAHRAGPWSVGRHRLGPSIQLPLAPEPLVLTALSLRVSQRRLSGVDTDVNDGGRRLGMPYFSVTTGIVAIALSGILAKCEAIPGEASAFWRMLIVAAVLLPWWLRHRPARLRLPATALGMLAGVFFGADIALFHDRKGITASESLLAGADCSCPRVFYQGVDTCSENAGTLPGGFTRKRCFE